MTSGPRCTAGAAAAPPAACAGGGADAKRGRRRAVLLVAASALACAAASLRAQSWPAKPVRLTLPAPPGSSIDVLGRLVAKALRERLGQPVVAENRPQAGGMAGTDAVAKATPDGYTIGLSFTGPLVTAQFLHAKRLDDPACDLAPIVLGGTAPNILAVTSSLPVRSFAEFVACARARPGQPNYASVGNGSASHLAMELLKSVAGLDVVHIPFNGAPPAVQATAAGDVQTILSNPTSLLPLMQAGRIRPPAVASLQRWPQMKELPTVAESGYPGFDAVALNGFGAPAGAPREGIARLNREINAMPTSPQARLRIEAAGWDIAGRSPESFGEFIAFERNRWRPVIRRSGVRLD
jgi:tripartite-type tricarboxylate transporter receptor subunit TctC